MCNATDDPLRERRHIDQLLGKRVDGLVVTARRADRREPIEPAAPGLPCGLCVLPGRSTRTRFASCRTTKAARRSRCGIWLLSAADASRISPGRSGSRRCACATAGYRAALAEAGLAAARRRLQARALVGGLGPRGRPGICSRGGRDAPDALFCGNDQIARGAIDALREMGRAVPADVAVVGFDNWEVMAGATRPPLTSVDMNLDALGREAGDVPCSK